MMTNEKKLNRDLIIGWSVIVVVLFLTYLVEVLKGERTVFYAVSFMIATGLPALLCGLNYRKNPLNPRLRYWIVAGYFVMYLFVMVSGNTTLVFTYILPLLSLLILYHQPNLVLTTGIIALVINIVSITVRILNHKVTLANSRDVEIQVTLLVLCFAFCYIGARLYDEIYHKNVAYVSELDEKSKQIQRMTLQTIETIANTIDAKDEYTKGHSRRVSEYAARIAEQLQMNEEEIMNIRYIALLHDIGKIGVPDSVLNKPGRLTDIEFDLMKKHTTIGGEILRDIGMLPDLDVGAKYHHERYDGKGYPNGIKGEEIPYTARIICVADAYDAMTSNRVYRKRLSDEEVLAELKRCRGTQFDSEITDAFLRYLENKPEDLFEKYETDEDSIGDPSNRLLQRIMSGQNKQAQQENGVDELTGVYNRSTGERKISDAMKCGTGCLILINIDNMRRINSKYGFCEGDDCIKQVADMLREISTDVIVSRFGGDEFLCYLPNVVDVTVIEEMIQDFMKEVHLSKKDGILKEEFGVSAGIAILDKQKREMHQLLMEADKALYHVKQESGHGYYFYRQVADRNDEVEKINWQNVFDAIRRRGQAVGTEGEEYRELVRIYDMINGNSGNNNQNVRLVMFTAKAENEQYMSVEQREEVMHMIEYAISKTLQNENACTKYSSIQRIVMLTGEKDENISQMTENILENFYKMYDKKDVELFYDIANIDAENSNKLIENELK